MSSARLRAGTAVALVALGLAGCAPSGEEVVVSAASSLTEAFGDLAAAYEASAPGVDVVLNLGGSAALREQILGGAPADVSVGNPVPFATNAMAIAVTEGNAAGISGVGDFADSEPFLGACAVGVPCGDLADEVFAAAGIVPDLDSREPSVRAVLTKVEAGDLDAGIVYVTDLRVADVDAVGIPPDLNASTAYPIVTLTTSEAAAGFVAFVLSQEGRAILAEHGFGAP